MEKILITGALGQLGTDLLEGLTNRYGGRNIIASDLKPADKDPGVQYEELDVLDARHLGKIIEENNITQVYHLAAILSAKAESNPMKSWDINMNGLFNVLEAARSFGLDKVFWPSSIAVFGPDTPKDNTPQHTITNPSTIYGIGKLAGERWCEYYHQQYGLDIRSVRYPGLIGYKSMAGGGTTDYAVDIYFKAVQEQHFKCFLKPGTELPMMYMKDAVKGTIDLMETDSHNISVRSGYNMAGVSFTPNEIYNEIKKVYPEFEISYEPDFRQDIAESWPNSINDSTARNDWGWEPQFNLEKMTVDIITHLSQIKIEQAE